MINPVNHATSPADVGVYKVEPYVVSADVYGVAPHTGRGGWSWYTGSAGWMYRLIVESLLGLRLEVDKLHFAPCLPAEWQSYQIHYRYRETTYDVTVVQDHRRSVDLPGDMHVTVDGIELSGSVITLIDDRQPHSVEVSIRAATS